MLQYKEIITYLFVIGIAQSILLALFLFNKKENVIANRLSAVMMIIFAMDLLTKVIYVSDLRDQYAWTLGLSNSFPYTYGPLIYLYARVLSRNRNRFRSAYMWHFTPVLLLQIYGVFFYYFEGADYHAALINQVIETPWHINLIGFLIPVSGVTYIYLTIRETVLFDKRLKENFSSVEKINLNWLKNSVYGGAIIWFIVIVTYVLDYIFGHELNFFIIIYIAISLFIYFMGFKSLKQPEITLTPDPNDPEVQRDSESSYKKSGLTEKTASEYVDRLLDAMTKQKPYLNNKINLSDLAELLNISTHNLSEVINTKLNQNFYDFINKYRVEEVIRLIENDIDGRFSILALGFEAGFSSKSAFYSAFKKVTDITPAQYREQMRTKKAG